MLIHEQKLIRAKFASTDEFMGGCCEICLGGLMFVFGPEIPAKSSLIKSFFLVKQESNVSKTLSFSENPKHGRTM